MPQLVPPHGLPEEFYNFVGLKAKLADTPLQDVEDMWLRAQGAKQFPRDGSKEVGKLHSFQ